MKKYSYSKSFKFYIALIILSLFLGILLVFTTDTDRKRKIMKKNSCSKLDNYFDLSLCFIFVFIIFTFICSVCYLCDDKLYRERWNNIIMTEFIFFKVLDFQLLTFFDIFDNSDLFNTTLAITLEKLVWMLIETIIEAFVENKKNLVIVQIIVTSIPLGLFIIGIIIAIVIGCKDKNEDKNENKNENENI